MYSKKQIVKLIFFSSLIAFGVYLSPLPNLMYDILASDGPPSYSVLSLAMFRSITLVGIFFVIGVLGIIDIIKPEFTKKLINSIKKEMM